MQTDVRIANPILISPIQKSERGVQDVQQQILEKLKLLRWDDLHFLVRVSEHFSLRSAAKALKVSVNTVRLHVSRLETGLGIIVFQRSVRGLTPTADGQVIIDIARQMQLITAEPERAFYDDSVIVKDKIQLCCSEGLAAFWLIPRLSQLRERLPECEIHIRSETDQARIHDLRNDISIGFVRPVDSNCIVTKLATVHMIPFCSDNYARTYGIPQTVDDLGSHIFIEQRGEGLNPKSVDLILGTTMANGIKSLVVNSSFSLFWAVANDLGIGALPTYVRSVSKRIHPIDLPIYMRFDVWLSFDARHKSKGMVRDTVDWLREIFSGTEYPWFADQFIHPRDFAAPFHDQHAHSAFDHLIDDPV
jgi:DNA-binding transcriptional LysR family regulator